MRNYSVYIPGGSLFVFATTLQLYKFREIPGIDIDFEL